MTNEDADRDEDANEEIDHQLIQGARDIPTHGTPGPLRKRGKIIFHKLGDPIGNLTERPPWRVRLASPGDEALTELLLQMARDSKRK